MSDTIEETPREPSPSNFTFKDAAIVGSALALLGVLLGSVTTGFFNQRLEREKLESTLILEAVKTPDRGAALANLLFFIDIGFIRDPDGRVRQKAYEYNPFLPATTSSASSAWTVLSGAWVTHYDSLEYKSNLGRPGFILGSNAIFKGIVRSRVSLRQCQSEYKAQVVFVAKRGPTLAVGLGGELIPTLLRHQIIAGKMTAGKP